MDLGLVGTTIGRVKLTEGTAWRQPRASHRGRAITDHRIGRSSFGARIRPRTAPTRPKRMIPRERLTCSYRVRSRRPAFG
jgi:hypothetical protein